jgi:hypothetical protein
MSWPAGKPNKTRTPTARAAKAILADVIAAVKRGDAHVVTGIVEKQRDLLGADGIRAALREALRVPNNARVIRCLLDQVITGYKVLDLVDSGLELSAIDAHAMDALASAVFPADPKQFDSARRDVLLHKAAEAGDGALSLASKFIPKAQARGWKKPSRRAMQGRSKRCSSIPILHNNYARCCRT